jgi:NADH-quinone oxidoreductase subunit K
MTLSLSMIALVVVFILLGVGLYALLVVSNQIKVMVALQILGKGAVQALVIAGSLRGQANLGQSMALTVIVADTIVAVVGLALAVQVRRHFGTLDLKSLTMLRR